MTTKVGDATAEISSSDSGRIVRIDVWTDGTLVNALRFRFDSGEITETYGMPLSCEPTASFEGKCPGSILVGIHGRFSGVLDKLGFSFSTAEKA
eukprot:CAMPEP_0201248244 /NCGR_PEP_ID=MMETSP0852-20130820/56057_1 /ASSEMBLY_ACC=CAM_ASM_000632 /TAXON_ID=183588 /ORGANISM="Pseudo-nitzschia fraudulenta, Strain WWA7" /LENGTH=93 /DNA_ID=CAMNT_0047546933 /DNA_START=5 /DNA_END=286 /DNA_ORIENTATION=+